MVVTTIGPDLHSLSIAFFLLTCQISTRRKFFHLCDHVLPLILAEHAKVRELIILPEAFVRLTAWLWCAEHTHTDGLPVDPVAFEVGAIWPDQFAIAAPSVLIVNDGLVSGDSTVRRSTLLTILAAIHVILRVDGNHAHLAHILERAKIRGLKTQFAVLDAKFLILIHCLDLLGQELELSARVAADRTRQIHRRSTIREEILDVLELLLIFDDELHEVCLSEGCLRSKKCEIRRYKNVSLTNCSAVTYLPVSML